MWVRSRNLEVTVKPEHFWSDWRLVGKFHRRTNELMDVVVMPPNVACPADAREYYCLLLLNGSVQESLRLRGLNALDRPLKWEFDCSGRELGWSCA